MALTNASGLAIGFDWEAAEGVRTDELRVTWARLEITVGDDVVTQVQDAVAGSVRRSIYAPMYPLAEWIAYNWWYLRSDVRPGYLLPSQWTFQDRVSQNANKSAWLLHHNLRAAGDGFAWPDLTIIPAADARTRLLWRADRSYPPGWRLRFLSDGHAEIDGKDVQSALASLVDAVITRLDEHDITDTPLHKEWRALQTMDSDEADFCVAAARLGLDPLGLPDEVSDLIVLSGTSLDGPLLDDFLEAADPALLRQDLDWIAHSSDRVRSSSEHTQPLPHVTRRSHAGERPWEVGLDDARSLRAALGLESDARVEPSRWIASERVDRVDRALVGLAGRSSQHSPVLALTEWRSAEAARFAEARALWRFATSGEPEPKFLITTARSPSQQSARAFAAEFLAPADGVRAKLPEEAAPVDLYDVEVISRHFGVNEWVVRYQIINQLRLELDDDPERDAVARRLWQ